MSMAEIDDWHVFNSEMCSKISDLQEIASRKNVSDELLLKIDEIAQLCNGLPTSHPSDRENFNNPGLSNRSSTLPLDIQGFPVPLSFESIPEEGEESTPSETSRVYSSSLSPSPKHARSRLDAWDIAKNMDNSNSFWDLAENNLRSRDARDMIGDLEQAEHDNKDYPSVVKLKRNHERLSAHLIKTKLDPNNPFLKGASDTFQPHAILKPKSTMPIANKMPSDQSSAKCMNVSKNPLRRSSAEYVPLLTRDSLRCASAECPIKTFLSHNSSQERPLSLFAALRLCSGDAKKDASSSVSTHCNTPLSDVMIDMPPPSPSQPDSDDKQNFHESRYP